jgi:hypothetical protein
MTVAIPVVKPVVTGCGMNSMKAPSRATPITMSRMPARSPAVSSPESPNFEAMGARMTMNAAVGPLTWCFDPPLSAMMVPATMAV